MPPVERKVFSQPDFEYLKEIAESMGLEVVVPFDLRRLQRLKEQGVPVPGDLDPVEAFWLLEIIKEIQGRRVIPRDFILYLNDRAGAGIPETDPKTILARQQRGMLAEMLSLVEQIQATL